MSMPYIGLLPFLQNVDYSKIAVSMCVNALHRASPISTEFEKEVRKLLGFVSMPYIGLLPFLHCTSVKVKYRKDKVSMPYIGLLPFLQYPLKNLIKSMVSGTVFRG